MRKCRILLSSPKVNYDLIIDEEKEVCRFNKKLINTQVSKLLDEIEKIIADWSPDTSKSLVVDGILLIVYFIDVNNNMKELRYNDLTIPHNFENLYNLLESFNGN